MSVKTTGIVKFTLDPKRPPALTKKAKARLATLHDENIDLTDIPPHMVSPGSGPAC